MQCNGQPKKRNECQDGQGHGHSNGRMQNNKLVKALVKEKEEGKGVIETSIKKHK